MRLSLADGAGALSEFDQRNPPRRQPCSQAFYARCRADLRSGPKRCLSGVDGRRNRPHLQHALIQAATFVAKTL